MTIASNVRDEFGDNSMSIQLVHDNTSTSTHLQVSAGVVGNHSSPNANSTNSTDVHASSSPTASVVRGKRRLLDALTPEGDDDSIFVSAANCSYSSFMFSVYIELTLIQVGGSYEEAGSEALRRLRSRALPIPMDENGRPLTACDDPVFTVSRIPTIIPASSNLTISHSTPVDAGLIAGMCVLSVSICCCLIVFGRCRRREGTERKGANLRWAVQSAWHTAKEIAAPLPRTSGRATRAVPAEGILAVPVPIATTLATASDTESPQAAKTPTERSPSKNAEATPLGSAMRWLTIEEEDETGTEVDHGNLGDTVLPMSTLPGAPPSKSPSSSSMSEPHTPPDSNAGDPTESSPDSSRLPTPLPDFTLSPEEMAPSHIPPARESSPVEALLEAELLPEEAPPPPPPRTLSIDVEANVSAIPVVTPSSPLPSSVSNVPPLLAVAAAEESVTSTPHVPAMAAVAAVSALAELQPADEPKIASLAKQPPLHAGEPNVSSDAKDFSSCAAATDAAVLATAVSGRPAPLDAPSTPSPDASPDSTPDATQPATLTPQDQAMSWLKSAISLNPEDEESLLPQGAPMPHAVPLSTPSPVPVQPAPLAPDADLDRPEAASMRWLRSVGVDFEQSNSEQDQEASTTTAESQAPLPDQALRWLQNIVPGMSPTRLPGGSIESATTRSRFRSAMDQPATSDRALPVADGSMLAGAARVTRQTASGRDIRLSDSTSQPDVMVDELSVDDDTSQPHENRPRARSATAFKPRENRELRI